jgi:hypothetical protein
MAEKRESDKYHDEAFRIRGMIIERKLDDHKHLTYEDVTTILSLHNENRSTCVGALTVDVNCSDALIGLKAVTREAKKATDALKELEEQQEKMSKGRQFNRYGDTR